MTLLERRWTHHRRRWPRPAAQLRREWWRHVPPIFGRCRSTFPPAPNGQRCRLRRFHREWHENVPGYVGRFRRGEVALEDDPPGFGYETLLLVPRFMGDEEHVKGM